jgi:hypothetical protein
MLAPKMAQMTSQRGTACEGSMRCQKDERLFESESGGRAFGGCEYGVHLLV